MVRPGRQAQELQIAALAPEAEVLGDQDAYARAVDVVQGGQVRDDLELSAGHEIVHALPQKRIAIIENETSAQREDRHRADAAFGNRHHW